MDVFLCFDERIPENRVFLQILRSTPKNNQPLAFKNFYIGKWLIN